MCVVGNDAEPRVGRVLLHDPSQGHLGRVGHGVGLVQNDELVTGHASGARGCADGEDLLGGRERLDLLAHHVDTSVVRGVELQHHLPHVVFAIDAPGEGQDGRGLARSRRAVEEEMRESVRIDKLVDGG